MDRMRRFLGLRSLILMAVVAAVVVVGALALAPAESEACPCEGMINYYSNPQRTNLIGQEGFCCGTCNWGCSWGSTSFYELDQPDGCV